MFVAAGRRHDFKLAVAELQPDAALIPKDLIDLEVTTPINAEENDALFVEQLHETRVTTGQAGVKGGEPPNLRVLEAD